MIAIETFKLKAPGFFARPKGMLGTCGGMPFPWTIVYGRTREQAEGNFKERYREQIAQLKD